MSSKKVANKKCLKLLEFMYKGVDQDVEDLEYKILNTSCSIITFRDKIIAECIIHNGSFASQADIRVKSIDFHGMYDREIREIFDALDVDLIRFGSIWVGYPIEEPIDFSPVVPEPTETTGNNQTIGGYIQYNEELRRRIHHNFNIPTNTVAYAPLISPTGRTLDTSAGYLMYYGGVYHNTDVHFSGRDSYAYNSPTASFIDDRPIPANPALASAQRLGVTQRDLETMVRTGRMRR